jgi:hypothetical protein
MEPITSVLDAFIKLADRIINLEKTKLQDKKDMFNEIVEPLFEELEPVAKDYILYFREIKDVVEVISKRNFAAQTRSLGEKRDLMKLARIKIRMMAKVIEDHIEDEEIIQFTKAIDNFFCHIPAMPFYPKSPISRTEYMVLLLDYLGEAKLNKIDIVQHIDQTLADLEETWGEIIQSYQNLKINIFSSPRFVRKSKKQ